MKWKRVLLWSVSILSCVAFCSSQSCSSTQVQYTPTSCLEIDRAQPNQAAQTDCINDGLTGLATIEEDGQYEILRSLVGVLGEGIGLLWLGYYYDSSGSPRLRATGAESQSTALGDERNFVSVGESAGEGVCIAMRRDGRLYRIMCTEHLPYACYQDLAPRITSISIDQSRFSLDDDAVRVLTCDFQPPDATVVWYLHDIPLSDNPEMQIVSSQGQSTLTYQFVSDSDTNGPYRCVVSNSVGGVASEAILLTAASGPDMPVPTIASIDVSPQPNKIRTGTQVNLTCNSNDTMATYMYEWSVNGIVSSTSNTNMYVISSFQQGGFYQCRAFLSTGENSISTIRLDAFDPPESDQSISAIPLSKTSIFVSWSLPDFSRDPVLLRYSLFYTTDDTLDFSTAESVPELLPTFGEDVMEYTLPNLEVGTDYLISVRPSFLGLVDENESRFTYIAASSTFGNAPTEVITGLKVSRSKDDKSLLAEWEKLSSSPPTGEIVLYEIEYRNKGLDISSAARIPANFNYFSIFGLEDASAYEVRVRAGVQVSSGNPPEYEFNDPTKWTLADRIVDTIPPPPPTLAVSPRLSGGAVAAIVVVFVCVGALLSAIMAVGLICCFIKTRQGKGSYITGERTGSIVEFSKQSGGEGSVDMKKKEDSPVTPV